MVCVGASPPIRKMRGVSFTVLSNFHCYVQCLMGALNGIHVSSNKGRGGRRRPSRNPLPQELSVHYRDTMSVNDAQWERGRGRHRVEPHPG